MDDVPAAALLEAFGTVPGLVELVQDAELAEPDDAAFCSTACELVLESLVGRKKISRSDSGRYQRPRPESRRRPGGAQDLFGNG